MLFEKAEIDLDRVQHLHFVVMLPAECHEVARRVVAADVPGDFVVCRQVLTGSAHHTLAAVALDDLRPSPRPEPPIDAGVTRMRRHGRPPALPHQER